MAITDPIRQWARRIKRDAVMLWFARRHPATPLLAKVVCFVAVAYALSPIDLIPDFIPVLGYLDEALLLPAMIWLAVRLLPDEVVATCRLEADRWMQARQDRPKSYSGAIAIIFIWIVVAALAWNWYRSS
ncbi:MAG: hypothetical protein JWR68_1531 [Polaromonas sp.]|nr:hypothetical protein [Polaromonas sp.]